MLTVTDNPLILAARAKALIESGEECYDALDEEHQLLLQESARAMLLAMRKPSAAILRAGATVHGRGGYSTGELDSMLVWERMIDAAESE
jgi:hypothetical protein